MKRTTSLKEKGYQEHVTPQAGRAASGGVKPLRGRLDRVMTETGGADQWVFKQREFPGFARVVHPGQGYPHTSTSQALM